MIIPRRNEKPLEKEKCLGAEYHCSLRAGAFSSTWTKQIFL